jgi:hypothetical protein
MEEPGAEQYLRDIQGWKPVAETGPRIREALSRGRTPVDHIEPLVQGLLASARAAFRYMETVHGLTSYGEIDRKNFVIRLAQVVESMDGLKHGGSMLRDAFQVYADGARSGVKTDHIDTGYFDAIQNFDVKGSLKDVLKDVELLLRSFSLVAAEKDPVPLEECWSVLFDLQNLFGRGGPGGADFGEDLEAFRLELEEIRKNNQN